jgi:hypothetical protein
MESWDGGREVEGATVTESNASQRPHQLESDRLLGLEEVQSSFPNRGV